MLKLSTSKNKEALRTALILICATGLVYNVFTFINLLEYKEVVEENPLIINPSIDYVEVPFNNSTQRDVKLFNISLYILLITLLWKTEQN
jgi:hypothetical protein